MQAAFDTAIWSYALQQAAIIVTNDEDFAQRKVLIVEGHAAPGLARMVRRDLLTWFETILPDVVSALERGETLIGVT